jgi:NNP family nitrate/nitrite transporter-like MFS transporter
MLAFVSDKPKAMQVLILNTLAFTVCFAVWTMYGVLGSFLADHRVLQIDKAQLGWLLGAPILTGSIMRLPVGMLTDRYGGKPVYIGVMLIAMVGVALTSLATSFVSFLLCGLLFGMAGAAFAVGIAYTSVFFDAKHQGTVLGVFGVGNAGSAVTTLLAPTILNRLTNDGQDLDRWRILPLYYAGALLVMTILFAVFTVNRKPDKPKSATWIDQLRPLQNIRVWRFGAYYFLVFGAFVALSQWLVPYYLNVYGMSLAMAGLMASIFSLPSGLIRALGGWASDKFGARTTMYWVLSLCTLGFLLIVAPRMDIISPGEGVLADRKGEVTQVAPDLIEAGGVKYTLKAKEHQGEAGEGLSAKGRSLDEGNLIWPTVKTWQEPAVKEGQQVKKKELLARGVTHLYFQANVWVFTGIVFLVGIFMGVGKAAVYRHIPDYFPNDVGVVGGLVGVIGGLGGFFCPILFGYLLKATGLWTSCWLFLALISLLCLVWMHLVILRIGKASLQKPDSGHS